MHLAQQSGLSIVAQLAIVTGIPHDAILLYSCWLYTEIPGTEMHIYEQCLRVLGYFSFTLIEVT